MTEIVTASIEPAERPPSAPVEEALAALQRWDGMTQRAYSENTRRAQKADAAVFQAFCERIGEAFFPAAPTTIRAFIEDCVRLGKKPATIRRYVATIARIHVAVGLTDPCASESVKMAVREMALNTTARQRQAWALGWKEIKEFIDSAGTGLRADRERALLCVAYDTMARRAELVALDLADVSFMPNGTGTVLIRRSKTDQEGQGAMGYLSRDSVRWLRIWLENAKIPEGAVFRRLVGQKRVGERLHPDIVSDIYKRVARWVGLPAKQVAQISGHSIRIGATQDLLALNIDLASVMQAGRWKSTAMPMRYGEQVLAARGGMARAAQAQGREEADREAP